MLHFTYFWHFHKEFELLYLIDGFGTGFEADSIKTFPIVQFGFAGKQFTHHWENDENYNREGDK